MGNWIIIVKKRENKFDYYSFEYVGSSTNFKGKMIYGEVGKIPNKIQFQPDELILWYQELLREGYKKYKTSPEKIPVLSEVKEYFGSNNFKKKYKIDSKGNIKNYNFERPNLNSINNIKVKKVNQILNDERKKEAFMRYFKTIPLNYRNNIRELGDEYTPGTIIDRTGETFYFVFEDNKILGIYSIIRHLAKGSIFYIKSNQNNKKEIVLKMLDLMKKDTRKDNITMTNISPTVKNVLMDLLGYDYLVDKSKIDLERELDSIDYTGNIFRIINKW